MSNAPTETTIERLVRQDVLINASYLVTDLLKNPDALAALDSAPDQDDLLDLAAVPDWSEPPGGYVVFEGDSTGWWWEIRDEDDDPDDHSDDDYNTKREAIEAAWEDAGDEPDEREVMEHWIVSDYLAEELEAVGAPVVRDVFNWNIWGRTETGQALTFDSDLTAVAALIDARLAQ